MSLEVVGEIWNRAAIVHPDEGVAAMEADGPLMFADAADAGRWLGMGHGGRWKTWVLGPLSSLPMIPWPKFDRFHRHEHEAEGAFIALKGAVEKAMVGAPIVEKEGAGHAPEARFAGVYPQESEGEPRPIGFIMKDACNDYDFATHMTTRLACLRGGNYDGPNMVSFRPPPTRCTLATRKGINDRTDHIVVVEHPVGDDRITSLLDDDLDDAVLTEGTKEIRIDCMSGVICVFWSRLSGRDMLAPYPDAAMGLCNDGLVAAGGAKALDPRLDPADGLGERQSAPMAWAFIVNPGKWTARHFTLGEGDDARVICVFSRDGAESFHDALDTAMPGVLKAHEIPPDPMQALQMRATELATDGASSFVRSQIDAIIRPWLPATILNRMQRAVEKRFWAMVSGCVSTIVFGVIVMGILALTALVVVVKLLIG